MDQYATLVSRFLGTVSHVFETRRRKYSGEGDPFVNFRRAAALQGVTPMKALGGMAAKHIAHLYEILARPQDETPLEEVTETLRDIAAYCAILYAMWVIGGDSDDSTGDSASDGDDGGV